MDSSITFTELLGYCEQETKRWKEWFALHPAALEVPFPIANASNVRGLLSHISRAELLFARALLNHPQLSWQEMGALADQDPFGVSEDATKMFREFIESASPEDWAEVKDVGFSGFRVSKRKMLTQALLHGINHRAQLSTHLRQQGFGDMWKHDFILTDVMP
jgi:uncharacterized damage-inducible protein DinB